MTSVGEKTVDAAITMSEAAKLTQPSKELQAAIDKVALIDFSMLKIKISNDEGMTAEAVDEIEDLYRKFLALNLYYPNRKICPTGPIDLFWHYHILDTQAYERDCLSLFGRLLHHFPYFGMRGAQDELDLEQAFNESVDLFVSSFGVDPTGGDTLARSCRSQNCP